MRARLLEFLTALLFAASMTVFLVLTKDHVLTTKLPLFSGREEIRLFQQDIWNLKQDNLTVVWALSLVVSIICAVQFFILRRLRQLWVTLSLNEQSEQKRSD